MASQSVHLLPWGVRYIFLHPGWCSVLTTFNIFIFVECYKNPSLSVCFFLITSKIKSFLTFFFACFSFFVSYIFIYFIFWRLWRFVYFFKNWFEGTLLYPEYSCRMLMMPMLTYFKTLFVLIFMRVEGVIYLLGFLGFIFFLKKLFST